MPSFFIWKLWAIVITERGKPECWEHSWSACTSALTDLCDSGHTSQVVLTVLQGMLQALELVQNFLWEPMDREKSL